MKFQFIPDEINEGSILLEYIKIEKKLDVSTKLMTEIKVNTFQKDYSR